MAIHNADYVLGNYTSFSDTYTQINSKPLLTTLLGGKAGMNPLMIPAYYLKKGYKVGFYPKLEDVPEDSDAYIVLYIYREIETINNKEYEGAPGAHYVAVERDSSTGELIPYNDNSWEGEPLESFYDFYDNDTASVKRVVVFTVDKPDTAGGSTAGAQTTVE